MTPCHWYQGVDSDRWATQCGRSFYLEEGTPLENHMQWCCYCGAPLTESVEDAD